MGAGGGWRKRNLIYMPTTPVDQTHSPSKTYRVGVKNWNEIGTGETRQHDSMTA